MFIRTIRDGPGGGKHSEASNDSPDYPKIQKRASLERWKAQVERKTRAKAKMTVEKARAAGGCDQWWQSRFGRAASTRGERRRSPQLSLLSCDQCIASFNATLHGLFAVVLFQNYKHQDLPNSYIY